MTDTRIRQGSDLPPALLRELKASATYPKHTTIPAGGEEIALEYRVTGARRIADEGGGRVKYRETFGWFLRNDEKIGAVKFVEWLIPPIDRHGFLYEMDYTEDAIAVADALCSVWDIRSLAARGSTVEAALIWVQPAECTGRQWTQAVNSLIDRWYGRRGAILIAQAFPLEYSNQVEPPFEERFAKRQAAMMRLYRRTLGVAPLPGWAGMDGWLWRPFRKGVPKPKVR